MSKLYLFADEAGNFDFNDKPGATKFFIIGTVAMENADLGHAHRLQRWHRVSDDQATGVPSASRSSRPHLDLGAQRGDGVATIGDDELAGDVARSVVPLSGQPCPLA